MWRVVCHGPGPREKPRRVVDRGPLQQDKARATAIADWLRSTGCYESVRVVASSAVSASPHDGTPPEIAGAAE